ncbi:hypothetical protein BHE74_00007880 [Ensete ventricosum]|nr:hypothetical protein BHE74_00007880 [Ensete ventricosum]
MASVAAKSLHLPAATAAERSSLTPYSTAASVSFSSLRSQSSFLGLRLALPLKTPCFSKRTEGRRLRIEAAAAARPTVLVAEKLGDAGLDLLRGFANVDCSYNLAPEELCAKISLCDALIVRSGTKVTREVFEAAKGRLKVVGRAGVGIDNVDLQAATEHGCLVVNAPTANTVAAAEHGIALLASMARNVAQADASMKAGELLFFSPFLPCRKWQRNKYVGVSLVGKTLAVMGFGKVGSEVARRAKGLGMHVIAHDPYAPADRARAIGVELVSFDEAISAADFISLHMPLTPSTAKLFNDETFAKVKKGAALDVFTVEPTPKDSKLVMHEKVTVTPHLGASTVEAQVLSELAPYVILAEKLGRLAVQLVAGGSGVKGVKVVYKSARDPDDLDTRILRAMVTKGIIEPISSVFVNIVNADYTAKQRGLRISEERIFHDDTPEIPLDSIQVQLTNVESKFASALSDAGDIRVEGRVKDGIPHLTLVGSFSVDVSLEGNLILCRQVDQPGMIGHVGRILGNQNVNINFMSVGRTAPRKHAIMAIGVDEEPDKETLKQIGEIPAIEEFVFLGL